MVVRNLISGLFTREQTGVYASVDCVHEVEVLTLLCLHNPCYSKRCLFSRSYSSLDKNSQFLLGARSAVCISFSFHFLHKAPRLPVMSL